MIFMLREMKLLFVEKKHMMLSLVVFVCWVFAKVMNEDKVETIYKCVFVHWDTYIYRKLLNILQVFWLLSKNHLDLSRCFQK